MMQQIFFCLLEIHSELVQACMTGDLKNILNLLYYYKESVEKLIKGDVAFTYKTKYGAYKPGEYLFLACENNHPPLVEHLLKLGADPTQMHNSMMTPLLSACQKGNLEVRLTGKHTLCTNIAMNFPNCVI